MDREVDCDSGKDGGGGGKGMDDADITLEEAVARYTDNAMAALADCLDVDLEPFARPQVPLAPAKRAASEE